MKVTQFLNEFDASMRFKLSQINERLVALERTIENCELSSGYLSNEVLMRGGVRGNAFISGSGSTNGNIITTSSERVMDGILYEEGDDDVKNEVNNGDKDLCKASATMCATEIKESLEAMGTAEGKSLEKLEPEGGGGSSTGGEAMETLDDKQNGSLGNSATHTPTKNGGIGKAIESSPSTNAESAGKKRPPRPGVPPPRPGGQSMPENAPPLPIRPTNS